MKNTTTILDRELLADEASQLGRMLDASDLRHVYVAPRVYQKAALYAGQIVAEHPACPLILQRVALSPALQELRSNAAFEKAITIGLLPLPESVKRCLQPSFEAGGLAD